MDKTDGRLQGPMRYVLLLLLPLVAFAVLQPAGRPSKTPFVSGDAFRAYSDHCYDEVDRSLDPKAVQKGDTVFVKPDFFEDFFKEVHPQIEHPYILITHNSDYAVPGLFAAMLDDPKIIAWFGQNYDGTPHPKMHPIPIGIANFCWPHGNADVLLEIRSKAFAKAHLAHMNIQIKTYPQERLGVHTQFSRETFCYRTGNKPFRLFLSDIASSRFEISPRGNGLDTHRLWESLYLGTIPIVKSSTLDSLYEGLPVLIIDDWKQVNRQFLTDKQEEFSHRQFSLEKTSMGHWIRLIDSYKCL